METVGAYEAKTHLPKLLKRVLKGKRITITKHGVPVTVLQTPLLVILVVEPVEKVVCTAYIKWQ
ncbi:MAG: type II toxin-antitoxin system prevent-host-death family antitoxin [Thermodesulfobacteriota bacterium]|nr:type II toxin-antitoxin system prevent-host-death family antitoxin [Thermodesulfobacteriota bacterium]